MAFVLDASVALSWCFADEFNWVSAGLLDRLAGGEEVIVPAHWPVEVLSALIQGKRRRRIDDSGIDRFLHDLGSFRITVEHSLAMIALGDLKTLSDEHTLSAYDAAYLDLAQRRKLPLATFDAALARAAVAEQVTVLATIGI